MLLLLWGEQRRERVAHRTRVAGTVRWTARGPDVDVVRIGVDMKLVKIEIDIFRRVEVV